MGRNDPVPPWDWRKGARNSEYKKQTDSTDTAALHGFRAIQGATCFTHRAAAIIIAEIV